MQRAGCYGKKFTINQDVFSRDFVSAYNTEWSDGTVNYYDVNRSCPSGASAVRG